MTSFTRVFLPSLLIAGGILLSGCSNSTTPTTTTTQPTVTPKAGSTYTYTKHERDSTSGKVPVTGDTTVYGVVVSSGLTFQGKSNVVTVFDDYDTLRYTVESNNDVSVYKANYGSNGFVFFNPSPWMTLPFGSQKTGVQLFPPHDTTIVVSNQQETLTITGTADYIGTDEIDTGSSKAKMVNGPQAKITIKITGTSPVPVTITSTQTFSFDYHNAGNYFHSISNTIFPDVKFFGTTILQGSTTYNEKFLTSFTLK